MAKIDHAGLLTESYEDAQRFFEEVFGMRNGERTAKNRPADAGIWEESS